VADLIQRSGVRRLVTFDLHAPQIEGFFDIPVDNLTAINMIGEHFRKKKLDKIVVVAPDSGGVKRARDLANSMNAHRIAIIDKYRPDYRKATAMNVVGKVSGMNAIIIDDFIDTGGSIVEAVNAIRNHGAKRVFVACTHALLTPPAPERLRKLDVDGYVFTETVPIPSRKRSQNMEVLPIASMISDTIKRITGGKSLHPYRPNNVQH
jgi:ribose-phosphate pyrophosphokinase